MARHWESRLVFRQMRRCLELYRQHVASNSGRYLLAFFIIATYGPLTVKELAILLGVPAPIASEAIGKLGPGERVYSSRPRKKVAGLVVLVPHPTDGRSKLVELTEKGHRLAEEMEEILVNPFVAA